MSRLVRTGTSRPLGSSAVPVFVAQPVQEGYQLSARTLTLRSAAAWICALSLALAWGAEPGVPDPALHGGELSRALERGGYVIFFRHADTGPPYTEPQPIDLSRCDSQRNLTQHGRAQAQAIGEQFKRLHIPVGRILTSEFCRCWQTALLAFGRYEKTPVLTGRSRDVSAEQARRHASDGLRELLGSVPMAGTNTVLVSHGFNLLDLEGFLLATQGEAAVFRPDGRGGYALVARVTPEEWARLPDSGG